MRVVHTKIRLLNVFGAPKAPFFLSAKKDRQLLALVLLTQEFPDGGTPAGVGQVRQLPNSLVEFVIRTDYEYMIIHGKNSQGRIR